MKNLPAEWVFFGTNMQRLLGFELERGGEQNIKLGSFPSPMKLYEMREYLPIESSVFSQKYLPWS